MMKASNPIISNPLSRSNKRSGDGPMILVWIVCLGVVFLCFFYFTVHQAISVSTQKNRIQIHAPQRINEESQVDVTTVSHTDKVILSTTMGDIVITLLPELSPESVAYIHDIVQTGCDRCTFYRIEKPGIFQGMIKSESIPPTSVKGQCPPRRSGQAAALSRT
ncbi:hypothetical protein MHU86_21437 [Fragilaria crotonensis]|nr:hypothetical protein MHU86_21437 [Fragilaria crotonensis]